MFEVKNYDQLHQITQDLGVLYSAQVLQAFLFDHHMPTRKVLSSIFQNAPFNPVVEFTDVKLLIKALAESKNDILVVWDLENSIPAESFLNAIKQLPRTAKTYFILTVQLLDRPRIEAMVPLGLSGVVMKPISIESLRSKIEEVCKIPTIHELEEFHSRHY